MRFALMLFINLAGIVSIGRPSPAPQQIPRTCLPEFDERIKRFENCDTPKTKKPIFTSEALPYVCALARESVVELCKENSTVSWSDIDDVYKSHANKTICPFNYAVKDSRLAADFGEVFKFFSDEKKCNCLCNFSNKTLDDCLLLASVNRITVRVAEQMSVPAKQIPLQQSDQQVKENLISDVIKPVEVTKETEKTESVMSERVQNKVLAVKTQSETDNKVILSESDHPTECDTKIKDGKLNNSSAKPEINHNSSGDAINGIAGGNKTQEKETVNDASDNRNSKQAKEPEVEANLGKLDVLATELPLDKALNEQSLYSPDSRRDYNDDTIGKASADDIADEDGNDEIPEKAELQKPMPDRDFEAGKGPNPKELYNGDGFFQTEDSHFSAYFLMTVSIIILGYIIYHNKNKIVAYALEGRRNRNGRRRPTSAAYRKLDCNLEEAIASNPSHASVTNVVY